MEGVGPCRSEWGCPKALTQPRGWKASPTFQDSPFLSLPLYPCPFYTLWNPETTMTRVRLHGVEGTLCTSEAWDLDPCPRCHPRISSPPSAYACSPSLVPVSPFLMSQARKKTSLISPTCLCLGCKADPSNSMQSSCGCHTSAP